MKNLKVDRFYVIFGVVMLVMAVIIIYTLRTVFSSVGIASEINEELLISQTPRVNKDLLDEAIKLNLDKEFIPLDL